MYDDIYNEKVISIPHHIDNHRDDSINVSGIYNEVDVIFVMMLMVIVGLFCLVCGLGIMSLWTKFKGPNKRRCNASPWNDRNEIV